MRANSVIWLSHSGVMLASKRATWIAGGAAALAVAVALVLVLVGPFGASAKGPGDQPCSSYPAPGKLAAAGTKVPAALAARYSLLSDPQRAVDRLSAAQVASLGASGVIMSGTRLLGGVASGGRIYLVPAEHLLATSLAPPRCLSAVQRLIQHESLSLLQSEYRQAALCIIVLYGKTGTHDCAPRPAPVRAHVRDRHARLRAGAERRQRGHRHLPDRAAAHGRGESQLLRARDHVADRPAVRGAVARPNRKREGDALGCSFLTLERPELAEYRAYVAGKLATLRAQVASLSAAIASGNLAAARSAWLNAHLTWLEIGQDDGAYGAFGPLGGEIDGLAAGHPLGTADPGFTGLHRIEFDLWTKRNLRAAATDTARLRQLLGQLMKAPLRRTSRPPPPASAIGCSGPTRCSKTRSATR